MEPNPLSERTMTTPHTSEREASKARQARLTEATAAMREFMDAHPDVVAAKNTLDNECQAYSDRAKARHAKAREILVESRKLRKQANMMRAKAMTMQSKAEPQDSIHRLMKKHQAAQKAAREEYFRQLRVGLANEMNKMGGER
jgi:uncharacterized coiled-coil DUF342 family protein